MIKKFVLLVLILFVSCSKDDKPEILPTDSEQVKMIKQADSYYRLFELKKEVKLKTNNEILIKQIENIWVAEELEKILIMDEDYTNLFVFDYNGNFVNKIGRVGTGPGEFSRIIDIAIKSDSLYIVDSNAKVFLYNINGQYLYQYNMKNDKSRINVDKIYIHNSYVYLYTRDSAIKQNNKTINNRVLKLDHSFNLIKGIGEPLSIGESNFFQGGGIVHLNNHIIYSGVTDGKIFKINNNDSLELFCDLGKLYDLKEYEKTIHDQQKQSEYFKKNMKNFDAILEINNVNDFIILHRMKYDRRGTNYMTIIDKEGKIIRENLLMYDYNTDKDNILNEIHSNGNYEMYETVRRQHITFDSGIIIPVINKNEQVLSNPTLFFYEMKKVKTNKNKR